MERYYIHIAIICIISIVVYSFLLRYLNKNEIKVRASNIKRSKGELLAKNIFWICLVSAGICLAIVLFYVHKRFVPPVIYAGVPIIFLGLLCKKAYDTKNAIVNFSNSH